MIDRRGAFAPRHFGLKLNCIVCDKPIVIDGANVCSTRCLIRAKRNEAEGKDPKEQPETQKKGNSAAGLISRMLDASRTPTPKVEEASMIKVAHPWMKNKNVVVGSTVFSFNDKSEALVPDVGNARLDVEALLKRGQYYLPEEKKEEEAKVAPPTKAPPPPPKEPVKETRKAMPAPEAKAPVVEEKKSIFKKTSTTKKKSD